MGAPSRRPAATRRENSRSSPRGGAAPRRASGHGEVAMKLHTPLCELLGIEHPIIQAGMAWDKRGSTSPPRLVAAVSNAGGLGVLGASSLQPERIRECIREVRAQTDRPFGVDIIWPRMSEAPSADSRQTREVVERDFPTHQAFVGELLNELALEPREPDAVSWVRTPAGARRQLEV